MASTVTGVMLRTLTQKSFVKGSICPHIKDSNILRLYNMRFCPYAHRTRLLLEAKKFPYEVVNINLKSKPDWFIAKNPIGLVPVIEYKNVIVYESLIVNDYLDEILPGPRLNSSDPFHLAEDRMLVSVSAKINKFMFKLAQKGGNVPDDTIQEKFLRHIGPLEEALTRRGAYFGGTEPLLVDYNLLPWVEKLRLFSLINGEFGSKIEAALPKLHEWIDTMYSHPHVKATDVPMDLHLKFWFGLVNGTQDYDAGLEDSDLAMDSKL